MIISSRRRVPGTVLLVAGAAALLAPARAGALRQDGGLPIAFFSDRDGNMEIYAMAADGSRQTRLTNHQAEDRDPAWSPDGQWIAFISRRDHKETEVFKMRADGSQQTRLTRTPASDYGVAWSPDGKRIAFVSEEQFNAEIFVMHADGTGVRNLTKNPNQDVNPSWTSDGKEIIFLTNRDDRTRRDDTGEVYAVNVETGEQRAITRKRLALLPSWLPVRNQVVFFVSERAKGTFIMLANPGGGETAVVGGGCLAPVAAYHDGHSLTALVADDDGAWIERRTGTDPEDVARELLAFVA